LFFGKTDKVLKIEKIRHFVVGLRRP